MKESFRRVYKILPDKADFSMKPAPVGLITRDMMQENQEQSRDKLFEQILERFLALALPIIHQSHLDNSIVNDILHAAQEQQGKLQIEQGASISIEDEMNPIELVNSARIKSLLENPLIFALVKEQSARDLNLLEEDRNGFIVSLKDMGREDITLDETLRATLENFPSFNEILKHKITEEEVRDIILAHYYNDHDCIRRLKELLHLLGIKSRSLPVTSETFDKRNFSRISPIAFLLEPHKALIAQMIVKITHPKNIHRRFKLHVKQGTKIPFIQRELDELSDAAAKYLQAKLVFFIFSDDLMEKMAHYFRMVYQTLPDGLDFLEKFLPLAVDIILKSYLPNPSEVINSIVPIAEMAKENGHLQHEA